MNEYNEWGSRNRSDLPEDKLSVLGHILTVFLRETTSLIHAEVLGDDERACLVAATVVFRFERFPGDTEPFTGIASLPDDPEIAKNMVEQAARAMEDIIGGGSG